MRITALEIERDSQHCIYGGTDRYSILFRNELPEHHVVNREFLWFSEHFDYDSIPTMEDVDRLQKIIKLFEKLDPPQYFEIIEATNLHENAQFGKEFLGFDVSYKMHYSPLHDLVVVRHSQPESELRNRSALVRLSIAYFGARLNSRCLFETVQDAEFFLECVKDIASEKSNFFEPEAERAEIVRILRL